MQETNKTNPLIQEHQFWLQIMGDHARFIFYSLAPNEIEFIQRSQDFIINYDALLRTSHGKLGKGELDILNQQALPLTEQFRDFKLLIFSLSLNSEIKLHLSATSLSHMLNELEEYVKTVKAQIDSRLSLFHPLHYHMLWLPDAAGHASSVTSGLDPMEKRLTEESNCFQMKFSNLTEKLTIINNYLITQKKQPPYLEQLNEEAGMLTTSFKEFLEDIRDKSIDGRILSTLSPLLTDHMVREECYYLWKLTKTAGLTTRLDCNPLSQRVDI